MSNYAGKPRIWRKNQDLGKTDGGFVISDKKWFRINRWCKYLFSLPNQFLIRVKLVYVWNNVWGAIYTVKWLIHTCYDIIDSLDSVLDLMVISGGILYISNMTTVAVMWSKTISALELLVVSSGLEVPGDMYEKTLPHYHLINKKTPALWWIYGT